MLADFSDMSSLLSVDAPALLRDYSDVQFAYNRPTSLLSVDLVRCMRCLSWPSQAADWPTRHRNYDWPDSATVDSVVNNGCDVVGVAHRQCRQHEWMGKCQWRLSFSRAEIILINSWMPLQQIVYHMLRVFMKTELLKDSDVSEALSNYHIKTLTMWACELKSSSFWTNDLNLIRICVQLLHTLSIWLTDVRCQHYFISNCNLLDNLGLLGVELIASQLRSVDEACISTWFVNNYIRKCSELCLDNTSMSFSDVSTNTKLQKAVSAVVNYRLNTVLVDTTWCALYLGQTAILLHVYICPLTVRSCVCWMTELAKTGPHLPLYFTAVAFLHVAYKISNTGFTDELMDVLATIIGQFFSRRCHPSQLSLSKATKLMKVVANSSRSTMQLIEILLPNATDQNTSELVELLQRSAVEHLTTVRQLEAQDFGSVVTTVTTDFEALYAYKHGDYQHCLQLSTQNVRMLLYADKTHTVPTYPELIQLLDDDIVSLTALTLIVNPECRRRKVNVYITQLTLSLYLMTQSQLKLRHSVAPTLDYIEVAQKRHSAQCMLDQLTLKLTKRNILSSIYT